MSRAVVVSGILAAAALASSVASAGSTASSATRTVDRTLTCTTGVQGGARVLFVRAQSGYGQGGRLEWLGSAYLATAGQPVPSRRDYRPTLAGVSSGWPPPPPLRSGGLGFENRRCAPTKARVALTHNGLAGGVAAQLGDELTCVVPKTVLVRLRVTFREPVALELTNRGRYYAAEGRIEQGQIAARTLAGKPLVYVDVREAGGTARLFTAKGCA